MSRAPDAGPAGAAMDAVNAQITDAVTQIDVKALAAGPAHARALALQAAAHAAGLALHNAAQAQAGMQQINNAAVAALIAQITGAETAMNRT